MPEFLTTRKTTAAVEDILTSPRGRIYLVSPYVKLSGWIAERIADTQRLGAEVTFICREKELSEDQRKQLEAFPNLDLRFIQHLHAKCYADDERIVVSSLNIHEFSEMHNREMGVLLRRGEDGEAFLNAINEIESLVAIAEKAVRPKEKSKSWFGRKKESKGFCIRCSKSIRLSPEAPFCRECYGVWSEWSNEEYTEKVCHSCGKSAKSSMAKPLCLQCYRDRAKLSTA